MRKNKILDLLNGLIDDWIDIYDVDDAIKHLIFAGATKEDLLELDFDKEDIDRNIKEIENMEE